MNVIESKGYDRARPTRRSVLLGGIAAAGVLATTIPAPADRPISAFRPRGAGGMRHQAFSEILSRHVRPDAAGYNRVDYRGMRTDAGRLKAYLAALQAARPSTFAVAEAHAYWINLYNAATLDVVLDHYPVGSIKEINLGGGGLFGRGPWSRQFIRVEGQALSLDDIEHRIVRPLFSDPMSHYALNCASYSCPNLATRAFEAGGLPGMMTVNGREYVNHDRGVAVGTDGITASKIYRWYADDFGGRNALKPHWADLADAGKAKQIMAAQVARYVYDWTLNDV